MDAAFIRRRRRRRIGDDGDDDRDDDSDDNENDDHDDDAKKGNNDAETVWNYSQMDHNKLKTYLNKANPSMTSIEKEFMDKMKEKKEIFQT